MPWASMVRAVARPRILRAGAKSECAARARVAGGDQVGLPLEHEKDARRTGLKLALFAGVLLFGGLARETGGIQAGACGIHRLQGVADIGFHGHTDLFLHCMQAAPLRHRDGGLRFRGAIAKRQRHLNADLGHRHRQLTQRYQPGDHVADGGGRTVLDVILFGQRADDAPAVPV
jgi:hypothetical protein